MDKKTGLLLYFNGEERMKMIHGIVIIQVTIKLDKED